MFALFRFFTHQIKNHNLAIGIHMQSISQTQSNNQSINGTHSHKNESTKGMIINHEMKVVAAGNNLIESWSQNNENKHPNELIGSRLTKYFKLRRPNGIIFDFANVRDVSFSHRRNVILICDSSTISRSRPCKQFCSKSSSFARKIPRRQKDSFGPNRVKISSQLRAVWQMLKQTASLKVTTIIYPLRRQLIEGDRRASKASC
jgi:hypothetical protein